MWSENPQHLFQICSAGYLLYHYLTKLMTEHPLSLPHPTCPSILAQDHVILLESAFLHPQVRDVGVLLLLHLLGDQKIEVEDQ